MDWKHYNVHWMDGITLRGKTCVTALSKEDAKLAFENSCKNQAANQSQYPFEASVIKVIGPLGRVQTPKQRLASYYRWILGNISSAEATLLRIQTATVTASGKKAITTERNHLMVHANIAKVKRDVKQIFIDAGINIK